MARPQLFVLVLTLAVAGCGNAGRVDEACRSNADCADDQLCALNFCTGLGNCEARPETCDEEDDSLPVCGCDGVTYPNSQCAAFAGVRLKETIACVCDSNADCSESQYCALEDSCENPGSCLDRPESCEPAPDSEPTGPVCGCDSVTYMDACEAARAGVRVSAEGECDCENDDDCDSADFCNALVCDGPGVCELRNDPSCEPQGQVTGCDGIQYESQCTAAEAGVRARPD